MLTHALPGLSNPTRKQDSHKQMVTHGPTVSPNEVQVRKTLVSRKGQVNLATATVEAHSSRKFARTQPEVSQKAKRMFTELNVKEALWNQIGVSRMQQGVPQNIPCSPPPPQRLSTQPEVSNNKTGSLRTKPESLLNKAGKL